MIGRRWRFCDVVSRTFSTSWKRLCHTPPLLVAALSAMSARAFLYSLMTCTVPES